MDKKRMNRLIIIITVLLSLSCGNEGNIKSEDTDKNNNDIITSDSISPSDTAVKNAVYVDTIRISKGKLLYSQGKYPDAIAELTRIIKEEPGHINAYYYRGESYLKLQQFYKALGDFLTVEKFSTGELYINAVVGKAKSDYELGRADEAIQSLEKLIEEGEYNSSLLATLGFYKQLDNNYKKGLQYLNEAIQLDNSNGEAFFYRALLFHSVDSLNLALNDINAAISQLDRQYDLYIARGLIYKSKKDFNSAEEDFTTAIELNPKSGMAYLERSKLRKYDLNDAEGAKNDDKALKKILKN